MILLYSTRLTYFQMNTCWNLTSFGDETNKENSVLSDNLESDYRNKCLYYIKSLAPHVSMCNVAAGSKIKFLSSLAGYKQDNYTEPKRLPQSMQVVQV